MEKIRTVSGIEFEVSWAAPAPITENITFLAKIQNSNIDLVHNTFKNPEETAVIVKIFEEAGVDTEVDRYFGYTKYGGFSVEPDDTILLTLKKNLGV